MTATTLAGDQDPLAFVPLFFGFMLLLQGGLSGNSVVFALSLLFSVPIMLLQTIADAEPFLAPLAAAAMVLGLFTTAYRARLQDAVFFTVAGCFMAVMLGV